MRERLGEDINRRFTKLATHSIAQRAIVDCALRCERNINSDTVIEPLGLSGGRQQARRRMNERPIKDGLICGGDESQNMRHCRQALSGSGSPLS